MTRFSFMFSLRAICIIIISSISTYSRSKFDTNLFSLEFKPNNICIHFIGSIYEVIHKSMVLEQKNIHELFEILVYILIN